MFHLRDNQYICLTGTKSSTTIQVDPDFWDCFWGKKQNKQNILQQNLMTGSDICDHSSLEETGLTVLILTNAPAPVTPPPFSVRQ